LIETWSPGVELRFAKYGETLEPSSLVQMPRLDGDEPIKEAVGLVLGQVDDACLSPHGDALMLESS